MTALMLLAPGTPMLFQGQEFGSTRPFVYFADHDDELARAVRQGRREFLAQFPSLADPEVQRRIPDPAARRDLRALQARLERTRAARAESGDCTAICCGCGATTRRSRRRTRLDRVTAVLGAEAMLLRYRARRAIGCCSSTWGATFTSMLAPEPLLAPPRGPRWRTLWSSEDPRYGGRGTAAGRDRGRVSAPRACRRGPGPGGGARERVASEPDVPPAGARRLAARATPAEALVSREWLLTNGLGGYACGTRRRRADPPLPRPARRRAARARRAASLMLNHLVETLRLADGTACRSAGSSRPTDPLLLPPRPWSSSGSRTAARSGASSTAGVTLEKRIVLTHHAEHTRDLLPAARGGRRP